MSGIPWLAKVRLALPDQVLTGAVTTEQGVVADTQEWEHRLRAGLNTVFYALHIGSMNRALTPHCSAPGAIAKALFNGR
ncbi:hypothetical protein [Ruegeria conchae]|uniref:hypothetical protein n=1 Tax=Ruegeria conchae TaxID=981384 RepID=UPI000237880A|nr:hypothetical protein [Ruegeria conchae]